MTELALPGEDASDEEVRQFVLRLREEGEIGRAVAARRIPRGQLGELLGQWADLIETVLSHNLVAQAVRAHEDGSVWEHAAADFPIEHQEVDPYAWRGAAGSPAENDLAAWLASGWPQQVLQPSHQQDRGPVLHLARRIVEAALDHLRGIAVLLAHPRIQRSPLALARVVVDGTAHACYLLESGITAEERLVRALNEVLARAGEDYKEAAREGNVDGERDAENEITAIFDAVGDRRRKQWKKKDHRRAPFIGESPVSTAALTRRLLDGGTLWSQLSGVVHLKEDEGWRIMLGVQFENPHRDSYLALHTSGALVGVARCLETLAPYTGWDLAQIDEVTSLLLSAWADGSGMRDELHRAKVLAEGSGSSASSGRV
jgi:hypothetical protein